MEAVRGGGVFGGIGGVFGGIGGGVFGGAFGGCIPTNFLIARTSFAKMRMLSPLTATKSAA